MLPANKIGSLKENKNKIKHCSLGLPQDKLLSVMKLLNQM